MITSHPSTTFTHACPWGCVVHVEDAIAQPHDCEGVRLLSADGVPTEWRVEAMTKRLRDKYAEGFREGQAIADLSRMSEPEADGLVALLAAHQIDSVLRDGKRLWYCVCDHVESYDDSVREHPEHVADVLRSAGFVR